MKWPKSPTKQQFEWTAAFYCLDTLVRRHRGESSDCLSSYSSNTSVKTCGFKWAEQTVDCSLSLRFIRNILQSNKKKSVIYLSKYCWANFPLRSHFWAVKQQFLFWTLLHVSRQEFMRKSISVWDLDIHDVFMCSTHSSTVEPMLPLPHIIFNQRIYCGYYVPW